ncbi:MAG: RloB domain-containing protein [Bacteroidetes bacterium]|nr:RloB domain-containing protein [Bacteroidota bacterium]
MIYELRVYTCNPGMLPALNARFANHTVALFEKHGIKVAYSNEAFELWYVLHFNYHQSATARRLYVGMLNNLLGVPYEKNRLDMYERLEDRQETAIRNAERLLNNYDPPDPARNNPGTTVHLLVQELNRFAV